MFHQNLNDELLAVKILEVLLWHSSHVGQRSHAFELQATEKVRDEKKSEDVLHKKRDLQKSVTSRTSLLLTLCCRYLFRIAGS